MEIKIGKLKSEILAHQNRFSSMETEYTGKITPLQASLKKAFDETKQLKAALVQARENYKTLIDQSKNIQDIVKENKSLQQENISFSAELKALKSKNRNLFKMAMIKWFLAGFAILLVGWLIGQSVSSKRRSYGSILD